MTPRLATARLQLHPLELSDADQIQEIFPQWDIVRFLAHTVPWPYPPDGALTFCRDHALPAIARGEEWTWTIRPIAGTGHIIGVIALMIEANNNRGFWMDPRWQGRGLMTEACEAVTDYWFSTLGFSRLRVPKALANTASRRISEKQGMRVIGFEERRYVSGALPAELWEITADEWRLRRSPPL